MTALSIETYLAAATDMDKSQAMEVRNLSMRRGSKMTDSGMSRIDLETTKYH